MSEKTKDKNEKKESNWKTFCRETSDLRKKQMQPYSRRFRWMFSRSGMLPLAFEHFLAMIPATLLVPVLVNSSVGAVAIDMSLVLFTSGIGSLIFLLLTKGKIPAYLGSSFAYIGVTIYLIQNLTSPERAPDMAFYYVGWAYIFSAGLLFILSYLYKIEGIERILSFLLPATVVGPAISLIGLELADTAIIDAGFAQGGVWNVTSALISMVTLVVIVIFSLIHHRLLKNAAIIVGIVVGCVLSMILKEYPFEVFEGIKLISVPDFNFHVPFVTPWLASGQELWTIFIAIIPSTLIVFTENIGRVTVISRMTQSVEGEFSEGNESDGAKKEDEGDEEREVIDDDTGENDIFTKQSVEKLHKSLFAHGISMGVAEPLAALSPILCTLRISP